MKKSIIAFFLIFVVACLPSTQQSSSGWNKGTEGLFLQYEPGEPKAEYLGNQEVDVTVKYENRGTSTASNIRFHLIGNDPNLLDFNLGSVDRNVEGRTQANPDGQPPNYAEWNAPINLPSSDIDSFDQVISVISCYDYATYVQGLICLEPETRDNPRCDYSVKEIGSSQGAPIAITQLSRQITNDEILVEVHVENKGSGNPITGSCVNPEVINFDVVSIEEVKIGGTRKNPRMTLPCNPKTLRLQNGKGYTVCKTGFSGRLQAEEQVYVDIYYQYREKLPDKKITILNLQ